MPFAFKAILINYFLIPHVLTMLLIDCSSFISFSFSVDRSVQAEITTDILRNGTRLWTENS